MEIKIGGTMSTTIIVRLSETKIKSREFLGNLSRWDVVEWVHNKYKNVEYITDWYQIDKGQFFFFDARRPPSK
jgi:hypothetical protein